MGGNLVAWSKKQSVVAGSGAKAEFWFKAHGVCEFMWERMLLTKLGFLVSEPKSLYYDNKAATSIEHNPVQHDQTMQAKMDHHFIKDHQKARSICMSFVKTKDHIADIFAKGLQHTQFSSIISKQRMWNLYSSTWGGNVGEYI